jgi:outer membrane immunogenic protein
MRRNRYLLASVGGLAAAASGSALAADLPPPEKVPAAPAPAAAPSWEGFYLGLNAGAAWESVNATGQLYTSAGASFPPALRTTTFIGGGQIGYNWQLQEFAYGLEADFSGLSHGMFDSPDGRSFLSSKTSWVATLRARAGITFLDNFAYVTGGVAFAQISNTVNAGDPGGLPNVKSDTNTRAGWVFGGGVEHMLTSHWTIGGEVLAYGFGHDTAVAPSFGFPTSRFKATTFSNQIVVARGKLNYKF